MRWCLTTGTKWIFGMTRVLNKLERKKFSQKYEYFTLEPMFIRDEPRDITQIRTDCLEVLRVLTYWVTYCPSPYKAHSDLIFIIGQRRHEDTLQKNVFLVDTSLSSTTMCRT